MYEKIVHYRFEVCGELIDITEVAEDGTVIVLEEVRKNGQEDTHMAGVLEKAESGVWVWEAGEDSFREYGSDDLADEILEHINKHGAPQIE